MPILPRNIPHRPAEILLDADGAAVPMLPVMLVGAETCPPPCSGLEQYVHTSGHGLGIGIHEYPSISYKAEGILEEGMVITIEPGLYYDWGGVRIEDVVVVTKNGFDSLSRLD